MDYFVLKMRNMAYSLLLRGFLTISIPYIQTELSFNHQKECSDYLRDHHAVIIKEVNLITKKNEFFLDCKESTSHFNFPILSPIFPLSSPTAISHTTSTSSLISSSSASREKEKFKNNLLQVNKNEKNRDKKDKIGKRKIILSDSAIFLPESTLQSASVKRKIDRGDIETGEISKKSKKNGNSSSRAGNDKRRKHKKK